MKISLGWLREYLTISQSAEEIADILTEIGLEVEGVETFESIKGSLKGLVVGQVKTCTKHPNADRLSLTSVDIGDSTLQIVCGAPNVKTGQKVVVAPVGTTLFDRDGKDWQIKRGKIRGEVSEGMICAEDEIGLGENHDGILVLPDDFKIGVDLNNYIQTSHDTIFEIGLTPNRSDATSHLGVARDLAAALRINYQHDGDVKPPLVDSWAIDHDNRNMKVQVLSDEGCPRYCGVVITGLHIKESPDWLKHRLASVGVRPINNVVDATNFVLHEMGQPLHAFDLKSIEGNEIVVRTLPSGTPFISLDGQERKLDSKDLMICDGGGKGMCIAGVFGGIGSGVTAETKEIFLESAHFNAKWTRRSSERHLLFTDAAKIFEKGSDPNICLYALKRAALLIKELTGGEIASEVIDIYPKVVEPVQVSLRFSQLTKLIGTEIKPALVVAIMGAMEMKVVEQSDNAIKVEVPTNKVDVTREADLIEEVLRIYGFNRVPINDRMSFRVGHQPDVEVTMLRNRVADYLTALGFSEIMGLSMLNKKYLESDALQLNEEHVVRINNTSNLQMELMRPNLWITALETVRYNQYRQQNALRLFEFGKSYQKRSDQYIEKEILAITTSGWNQESWLQPGLDEGHEFFALKSVVGNVLKLFGIAYVQDSTLDAEHMSSILRFKANGKQLAYVGELSDSLCQEMDVRNKVFYAEFDWVDLVTHQRVDKVSAQESSKYPVVRRDLALVVDKSVAFDDLFTIIQKQLGQTLRKVNLFDVYTNEEALGPGKKSYALSILLSDKTKTFSDKEIDKMISRLTKTLDQELGARLR